MKPLQNTPCWYFLMTQDLMTPFVSSSDTERVHFTVQTEKRNFWFERKAWYQWNRHRVSLQKFLY